MKYKKELAERLKIETDSNSIKFLNEKIKLLSGVKHIEVTPSDFFSTEKETDIITMIINKNSKYYIETGFYDGKRRYIKIGLIICLVTLS
jgi:hypothetical protein